MIKKLAFVLILAVSTIASADENIPEFLVKIESKQDFQQLSRQYKKGDLNLSPHVMYLVDQKSGKFYFINTSLYKLHRDFANALGLSGDHGKEFYRRNYSNDQRRFIMGTIAYQEELDKYTFETWEGDVLSEEVLNKTYKLLTEHFFTSIYFKPNSLFQEELAASMDGVQYIDNDDLSSAARYRAINYGSAVGRLRFATGGEERFEKSDIVIFESVPVQIVPVSGIISTSPGSPLSHISMLSRAWKIPYATIRDADKVYKRLEGKYVKFTASEDGFEIVEATDAEIEKVQNAVVEKSKLVSAEANLDDVGLKDLVLQRKGQSTLYGAKSANLGELMHIRSRQFAVPSGFTIPFHYYQAFVLANGVDKFIAEILRDEKFRHDLKYRNKKLQMIRDRIQSSQIDPAFAEMLLAKVHSDYAGKSLFVRSSTNAEDLPEFSGAGLYSTVPNVRNDEQLIAAVKTVWASVWNSEAYEAREDFGIAHLSVFPAVIVQEGISADAAGVMVTANPFDKADHDAVYINAKKGLGMKVVDGHSVPEQIIFHPRSNSINILTRSKESTMLVFDQAGGIKNVEIESARPVLSEKMIRKLVAAAKVIKARFKHDQDIEWVVTGDQLYIVQSRPYIEAQ